MVSEDSTCLRCESIYSERRSINIDFSCLLVQVLLLLRLRRGDGGHWEILGVVLLITKSTPKINSTGVRSSHGNLIQFDARRSIPVISSSSSYFV